MRVVAHIGGDQVIGDKVAGPAEPERRNLGQDLALVWNARPEHVVKRRDAVRRDDQQLVPEVVDIAHLAALIGSAMGDGRVQDGSRE